MFCFRKLILFFDKSTIYVYDTLNDFKIINSFNFAENFDSMAVIEFDSRLFKDELKSNKVKLDSGKNINI